MPGASRALASELTKTYIPCSKYPQVNTCHTTVRGVSASVPLKAYTWHLSVVVKQLESAVNTQVTEAQDIRSLKRVEQKHLGSPNTYPIQCDKSLNNLSIRQL